MFKRGVNSSYKAVGATYMMFGLPLHVDLLMSMWITYFLWISGKRYLKYFLSYEWQNCDTIWEGGVDVLGCTRWAFSDLGKFVDGNYFPMGNILFILYWVRFYEYWSMFLEPLFGIVVVHNIIRECKLVFGLIFIGPWNIFVGQGTTK